MNPAANMPMDQTPARTTSNLLLIVVSGVLSFLLWLAVVGQLVFFVPRVERLLDEFKMKTPLLTDWVFHYSRWAVPAIAGAALLVGLSLGRHSIWPWLFFLFLLPLVINVLVGVSLLFPYMELFEGLAGGGKK